MRKVAALTGIILVICLSVFLIYISVINRDLGNTLLYGKNIPDNSSGISSGIDGDNPASNGDIPSHINMKDNDNKNDSKDNDNNDGADPQDSLKETRENDVEETPLPPPVVRECLPENYKDFYYEILVDGKKTDSFRRNPPIFFDNDTPYSRIDGITTFRGDNLRNNAAFGYAEVNEKKLEPVWTSRTGYIDTWTGVGWTGQPALVRWPEEIRKIMNIHPSKKDKDGLVEVIYASLDGNIYFLDIDDGQPTRPPISIGFPIKGSVAVDPRGYPLLYVGQGIQENNGRKSPFYYRIFSLLNQKQLFFIDGHEQYVYRYWGAFDASPVVHAETDTLILTGENGIVYTVKLNTEFKPEEPSISIRPEIIRCRYLSPFGTKIGIENSPAIFRDRLFFADNSGLLQCININTMQPEWIRYVNDDTDSTIAIEAISRHEAYIYTANEIDHQGKNGICYLRKINAFSGELVWEKSFECTLSAITDGGVFASPVVGTHNIDNLVIFSVVNPAGNENGGLLIALDRKTGETVWEINLKYYSWSSPTAIYTEEGKAYLVVCDIGGYMRLFDGETGEQLDVIGIRGAVEASPAVFGNMIVVGTRGQEIWGVKIK